METVPKTRRRIRIPFLQDGDSGWKVSFKNKDNHIIGSFKVLDLTSNGAAIQLDENHIDLFDNIALDKINASLSLELDNKKFTKRAKRNGSTILLKDHPIRIVSKNDDKLRRGAPVFRVEFIGKNDKQIKEKEGLGKMLSFNDNCEYVSKYIKSDSFCKWIKKQVQYNNESLDNYLYRILRFMNNFINSDLGMVGYVVERNKDQYIIVDNNSLIGHRLDDFRKIIFRLRKQNLSSLDHFETNFYKNQEAIYSCMAHSRNSGRISRIHYPDKKNEDINPNDFCKMGGMDEKDLQAARQGKFNRINENVLAEITIPLRLWFKHGYDQTIHDPINNIFNIMKNNAKQIHPDLEILDFSEYRENIHKLRNTDFVLVNDVLSNARNNRNSQILFRPPIFTTNSKNLEEEIEEFWNNMDKFLMRIIENINMEMSNDKQTIINENTFAIWKNILSDVKEESRRKNNVFALLNYELIKPQVNEIKKENSLNQKILLYILQTIQREVEVEITKVNFDYIDAGDKSTVYKRTLLGHTAPIRSIAISPNGDRAISGSADNTLRLWNLNTGRCLQTFNEHASTVYSVAISNDGKYAFSGSDDNTLKQWDLSTGACLSTFRGHDIAVRSVAITKDGEFALSGSVDKTIKLWEINTKKCLYTFKGHDGHVHSVAITPNDKQILTGSDDSTLKLWDLEQRACIATLRGHTDFIFSIAITPDGMQALSGSGDRTIKLWDLNSHKCIATFEGHTGRVYGVALSPDGEIAASASQDGTVKLWDLETGLCLKTLEIRKIKTGIDSEGNQPWNVTFSPDGTKLLAGTKEGFIYLWSISQFVMNQLTPFIEGQVRYTNAKVVLIGESGVGKTSLATRLIKDVWQLAESTHGMQVWPFELPQETKNPDTQLEVFLWDLAGQPEFHLIHQLFLDETTLALVLFDPSNPHNPFRGIEDWEKALRMAVGSEPRKILVATRCDRGGPPITEERIKSFCKEHNYIGYFSTSAKTGAKCNDLRQFILENIPLDTLPWNSTTILFKTLKDSITRLKDKNICITRYSELRQQLLAILPDTPFEDKELRAVIKLLEGHGIIKQLSFGDFILLQPEQLNNYASAIIRAARKHVDEIGAIHENDVLSVNIDFEDLVRLEDRADEEILLRAIVQTFIDKSLCISETSDEGEVLIFPSQFNRERPIIPSHPDILVTYRFSGHIETIYTTLVVKLYHSEIFKKKILYQNAADFYITEKENAGNAGFVMRKVQEGRGEIKVFFSSEFPNDKKVIFIKYIHKHLLKLALDVERMREYVCLECNYPVTDREITRDRDFIFCQNCGEQISLVDIIETMSGKEKFDKEADKINKEDEHRKHNEILKLILKKHIEYVAVETQQIYRHFELQENGIDGEIEFTDDHLRHTRKKIYLQLGSSKQYDYLIDQPNKDGKDVYIINDTSNIKYWRNSDSPIFLITLGLDREINWMNITEYLNNLPPKRPKKIAFDGEPFNSYNLMRVRENILGHPNPNEVVPPPPIIPDNSLKKYNDFLQEAEGQEWSKIRFSITESVKFKIEIVGNQMFFPKKILAELGLPNESFELLCLIIHKNKCISNEDVRKQGYRTAPKQRISKLRCRLKKLFRIKEDPIKWVRRDEGQYYEAQFLVKSDLKYPTFSSDERSSNDDFIPDGIRKPFIDPYQ